MSFLKKVAKIAAPFASFIPGIGPLIGAGLGLVGGIGGGGSSNSSSGLGGASNAMNAQLMQQLLSGVTQQQGMAQGAFNKGNSLIDTGNTTMGAGIDYHKNILGGGADKALAGPISDMFRASNQGLQNTAQFGSRGGQTASSMGQRGSILQGQVGRLKTDSLNNSANSLLAAGGTQLGAGSNILGQGMGGFNSSLSTLLGARGQDITQLMQQQAINAQNSQGLGKGIGGLLSILLGPGGLLNKGKTSSKPTAKTPDWTGGGMW